MIRTWQRIPSPKLPILHLVVLIRLLLIGQSHNGAGGVYPPISVKEDTVHRMCPLSQTQVPLRYCFRAGQAFYLYLC
jgi:hypothetical protein